MAATKIVTGYNNFVGVGADRIALINCIDCNVEQGTTGLVAVNCSGETFTNASGHNSFYLNGGVVQGYKSITYTPSTSAPLAIDVMKYNLIYINTSLSPVSVLLDCRFMKDRIYYFKIIDATNTVTFYANYGSGSEQFEFNAMPYVFTPTLGDSLTVTYDGSNFYII